MRSRRADLLRALALAAALRGARGAQAQDAGDAGRRRPRVGRAGRLGARAGRRPARRARSRRRATSCATTRCCRASTRNTRPHWKDDDEPRKKRKPARDDDASWFSWLAGLGALPQRHQPLPVLGRRGGARGRALVSARHLVQLRAFAPARGAESAVSHVRDLDVRPESLPDDVGAAAWALWQAGKVPAALSLLYRGALSRLIHRFEVPITVVRHRGRVPGPGARPARAAARCATSRRSCAPGRPTSTAAARCRWRWARRCARASRRAWTRRPPPPRRTRHETASGSSAPCWCSSLVLLRRLAACTDALGRGRRRRRPARRGRHRPRLLAAPRRRGRRRHARGAHVARAAAAAPAPRCCSTRASGTSSPSATRA